MSKPRNSLLNEANRLLGRWTGPKQPEDLVAAILLDHEALKKLIKTLKDHECSVPQKKVALKRFSSLLASHVTSEEKALYSLSEHLRGSRLKTEEGVIEHEVADSLLGKIKPARGVAGVRRWKAQVQVLGELVEHHLKEEERDLLPKIEKHLDRATNQERCAEYLKLRKRTQKYRDNQNSGSLAFESSQR